MHILVTGATGFIGYHTCSKLVEDGFSVSALVRPESRTGTLESLGLRQIIRRDGLIERTLADFKCDAIVHCAAAYGRGANSSSTLLDANVLFPLQLLDHANVMDARLFLYLDTCFSLDYPYLLPYTTSKKQMVQWGRLTPEDREMRFVNLQLQHPFGPGDRDGKFVPWIIKECLSSASIDLTSGAQAKDFIFVSDVADAISRVLQTERSLAPGFHEFECGRGEAIAVKDFVENIHRLTDSAASLNFGALATRDNELMFSVAEIKPLRELGWQPSVSIEQGLIQTIESIREPS